MKNLIFFNQLKKKSISVSGFLLWKRNWANIASPSWVDTSVTASLQLRELLSGDLSLNPHLSPSSSSSPTAPGPSAGSSKYSALQTASGCPSSSSSMFAFLGSIIKKIVVNIIPNLSAATPCGFCVLSALQRCHLNCICNTSLKHLKIERWAWGGKAEGYQCCSWLAYSEAPPTWLSDILFARGNQSVERLKRE